MIHDLTRTLIDDAWEHGSLRALLARVCPVLAAHGVPVCRVSLGLETLHPEASGSQLVWRDGQMEQHDSARADHLTGSHYIYSPTKVVDDTGRPFRWRAGESDAGMPMLAELRAEGVTDYLILPLPFLDTTRTAATSRPSMPSSCSATCATSPPSPAATRAAR